MTENPEKDQLYIKNMNLELTIKSLRFALMNYKNIKGSYHGFCFVRSSKFSPLFGTQKAPDLL